MGRIARHARTFRAIASYPQNFASQSSRHHKIGYQLAPASHNIIAMKTPRISPHRTWHGVRMRRIEASPDPDTASRSITLPASWVDAAAAALAALDPGKGPVTLA